MTSRASPKVRLVRCPKCRQVLAELPDVPLYKCGGCGTVLRAKTRKPELESTDSLAKIQSNELLEAGSSSQPFTSSPEIETMSSKDSPRCNGNSSEHCEGKNVISSSPETARFPDAVSPDSLGKISNAYRGESSRDGSFSDELLSSGELSPEPKVHSIPEIEQDEKDPTEDGESEWAKVRNSPENVLIFGQKEGYNIQERKGSKIIFSTSESISPPPEQIEENNRDTNGFHSNAASRCPSRESLVSFYLSSSDNELPGHFPGDKGNFGRFSSIDTFGSSSPPIANYPKHGSYYSWEGSEFSCVGNYDRILLHQRQSKAADTRNSEMVRENRFRGSEPEWGPRRSHQWNQPAGTGWFTRGNRPRLDLLRTVCELQDQLNRMQFPENRRCGDHFPPEREVYSDARHPRGYTMHRGQVEVFPGKRDPPLSFPEPQFNEDEVTRARLKEKYFAGKRHLRPVAGGPPLVACFGCGELLGLPADFILFDRKKGHRLKCGVCQMVLRFSLCGGTHMVPYVAAATEAVEDRKMKSVLRLHTLMGYSSPSQVLDN